jgi:DNA-binding NtrC family response regulator
MLRKRKKAVPSSKGKPPRGAVPGFRKPRLAAETAQRAVLLVEADHEVGSLLTGILNQIGFKVIRAASSGDALAKAEEHEQEIHLLVADAEMLEVSRVNLATRFCACRPKAKIVLVSGLHQVLRVRDGGWSFLPAAVIWNELKSKLDQVLASDDPPQPTPGSD